MTVLQCPVYPVPSETCAYKTLSTLPSILAELAATLDDLRALTPALLQVPGGSTPQIYTEATAAMRDLRRVAYKKALSRDIHEIVATYPSHLQLLWIRLITIPGHIAADSACHPTFIPRPLPLLRTAPPEEFLQQKKDLGRATPAFIPPCGTDPASRLSRLEEALLRRLRVGIALSPALILV